MIRAIMTRRTVTSASEAAEENENGKLDHLIAF